MNSKLLIFALIVIGFQSIHSFVLINDYEDSVKITVKESFVNIKELTFNRSDNLQLPDRKHLPEMQCVDYIFLEHKTCKISDGKYQSKIVKCENINYGKNVNGKFVCEHFGQRIINKNVKPAYQTISCPPNTTHHNAKGRCYLEYSLVQQPGFTENDDVSNHINM